MKQTAVEWLEFEINRRGPKEDNPPQWLKELYEQAKDMEKEQIIESASVCCASIELSKDKKSFIYLSGEAFYKAKYIEKVI
jgi:hypothetical protein